jgi:hypothetical protein
VLAAVVGLAALAYFNSSGDEALGGGASVTANAASQASNPASNTARGLASKPSPAAARDAAERVVEITVNDGKADVYLGPEKVGTTPYAVRGRLGERVRLLLRREGYADEPVDFVVSEKKAYMYALTRK